MANAGHLSPYRKEQGVGRCGAAAGHLAERNTRRQTFKLETGDQLTLLSDGVLEAMDAKGELFGFERMRAISAQTAAEIAAAARRYGQEDDITVLTREKVRRETVKQIESE